MGKSKASKKTKSSKTKTKTKTTKVTKAPVVLAAPAPVVVVEPEVAVQKTSLEQLDDAFESARNDLMGLTSTMKLVLQDFKRLQRLSKKNIKEAGKRRRKRTVKSV